MPNRLMAWRGVAAKLGGRATVDTGHNGSKFRLVVPGQGAQVTVIGVNRPYMQKGDSTQIMAEADIPFATWFVALPRWSLWTLRGHEVSAENGSRLLYRHDCRSNDPGVARAWVDNAAREAFRSAHYVLGGDVAIRLRRGRVEVRTPSFLTDGHRLLALVELASRLSSRRRQEIETSWAQSGASLGARLSGPLGTLVVDRHPITVELSIERRPGPGYKGRRAWTVVAARRGPHAKDRWLRERGARASVPSEVERHLAPRVELQLGHTVVVEATERLEVRWPGIELRTEALSTAVDLVDWLARREALAQGPYR